MPQKSILLYDGQCRFCRWSAAKVLSLDRGQNLRPVDLHSLEATRLLEGLSEEERLASWHLVVEGRSYSAGAAFAPLLDRLLLGSVPAWFVKRSPRMTERAYSVVASRRSALGKMISDRADRRARSDIAERT